MTPNMLIHVPTCPGRRSAVRPDEFKKYTGPRTPSRSGSSAAVPHSHVSAR